MNILSVVNLYPPRGAAGAEWYLHELNLRLKERGHACVVWANSDPGADRFDGIPLRGDMHAPADVVVTQLEGMRWGRQLARKRGIPWVHIAHGPHQFGFAPTLQVANSRFTAKAGTRYGEVLVCRPHTPSDRYRARTLPPQSITLLNLSQPKGGHVLYDLARRMPTRQFLGVTGAWGRQLPAPKLDNLEVWPNQPDVRKVYARTRILLMPSDSETWGRCAVEAAHNGIPTVATPTEGVIESMGEAAIYTAASTAIEAVHALDDPHHYLRVSDAARRRASQLEVVTHDDLTRLCEAIEALG